MESSLKAEIYYRARRVYRWYETSNSNVTSTWSEYWYIRNCSTANAIPYINFHSSFTMLFRLSNCGTNSYSKIGDHVVKNTMKNRQNRVPFSIAIEKPQLSWSQLPPHHFRYLMTVVYTGLFWVMLRLYRMPPSPTADKFKKELILEITKQNRINAEEITETIDSQSTNSDWVKCFQIGVREYAVTLIYFRK